jgi:CubicO group peptidase (beta-lactamase class C family)
MFGRLRMGICLVLMVSILIACNNPNESPDMGYQIDQYLIDLAQEGAFSGAVLVARQSEVLLSKGYGMADAKNQIPNTPQTRFRIHWVTMQFTAMAVLML